MGESEGDAMIQRKLTPGLYASEDGQRVVLLDTTEFEGGCAGWNAIPPNLSAADTYDFYISAGDFRRRYPLRVVRCEVEK